MFKNYYIFFIFAFGIFVISSNLYSQGLPNFAVDSKTSGANAKSADPDINAFIPVEKQPAVKKKAMPSYPSLAQSARLEGKVWIKVLVEKDGKPKKAVVIKSDAEVFNDASTDAAMRSSFDPAEMNGLNVACWCVITYDFKLK